MRVRIYGDGSAVAGINSGEGGHGLVEFDGQHGYHAIHVNGGAWSETTVTVESPATPGKPAEVTVHEERAWGTVGGGINTLSKTTRPDGSVERESTANQDGMSSTTESSVDAQGGVTITTYTRDNDGSSRTQTTRPDGTETIETVTPANGGRVTETVEKDAAGEVTSTTRDSFVSKGDVDSKTTSTTRDGLTRVVTETSSATESSVHTTTLDSDTGADLGSSTQSKTWNKDSQSWTKAKPTTVPAIRHPRHTALLR